MSGILETLLAPIRRAECELTDRQAGIASDPMSPVYAAALYLRSRGIGLEAALQILAHRSPAVRADRPGSVVIH